MLKLINLACRREREVLFSGANEFFTRSQKVGVTGANGCGKSSLFGMILGQIDADEGDIVLQSGITVAHVAQEHARSSKTALDYVIDGDRKLRELETQLAQYIDNEPDAAEAAGMRHAALLVEYENQGGYSAASRAGGLLFGLGFTAEQHSKKVNEFSGGWLMRLNLAQALMCPSDLLLLDEPTNHLDLDAVLWLESWLQRYEGMLLLISHDREFLDRTAHSIVHIEHGKLTRYTGNYSDFERLRAERLAGQQAMYTKQQREVKEIQRFVDRFRAKATKARQAQSRIKMLERMSLIAPAHVDSQFSFGFSEPDKLPDPLVTLHNAGAGYGESKILERCNFDLRAGDRIALLGMNGAGKSTLIKTLVGELPLISGERNGSQHLSMGYFAQHQIDQLEFEHSALDHLMRLDPELSEASARNELGGFGFVGEQALQKVATMSGGEKARLALALIVHLRPNLLLLDEPTNHLDLQMRHALGVALQTFSGALIVVSHDRFLLQSVADQLWLVADGRVLPFDDDLDGYARWLSKQRHPVLNGDGGDASVDNAVGSQAGGTAAVAGEVSADGNSVQSAAERKQQKRLQAELRQQLTPLRKQVQASEKLQARLAEELAELQEKLADNQLYSSDKKAELAQLLLQQADVKKRLMDAEESWLEASEALQDAGG